MPRPTCPTARATSAGIALLMVITVLVIAGDQPQDMSRRVYRTSSIELIRALKAAIPSLKVYAGIDPYRTGIKTELDYVKRKIDAGADFIQTQCIYNMPRFRDFMKKAVDMGLTEKAYILAGVTPMKSARMAQYMAKMVPGMDVPEELIERLKGAGKGKQAEEGIKFAIEQIEEATEE